MALLNDGLAWNQDATDRRRLTWVTLILVPVFLVLAAVIPFIHVPEPERAERDTTPPQLARLLIEEEIQPEVPPVTPEPEPEPIPAPEPEPEPEPEPKPAPRPSPPPEPQPEPVPTPPAPDPVPEPAPRPAPAEPATVEQARETARNTGILAMSSELSAARSRSGNVRLETNTERTPVTERARTGDRLAERTSTERTAGASDHRADHQTRQVAMQERAQTEVAAPRQATEAAAEPARQVAPQRTAATRSREDLRRTMDANKSAVFSIYNRELRRNPSLRGTVTPELVIEESGAVSSCKVVESTLDEPNLEERICARLMLVNFGEKSGAEQTTIRYPIELLPG